MKSLLLWALLLFAIWKGYAYFADRPVQEFAPARVAAGAVEAIAAERPTPPDAGFQCDGRVHCSQMASRAEAEFFVEHCPSTKMDGDHDGEPCENDSRF